MTAGFSYVEEHLEMPKRCILYPNDINYLSYSPKYFYSGPVMHYL